MNKKKYPNIIWDDSALFFLISEARKYQRQMRKLGYKTKAEKHAGIAIPYTVIYTLKIK
jgi:hypothetical protein